MTWQMKAVLVVLNCYLHSMRPDPLLRLGGSGRTLHTTLAMASRFQSRTWDDSSIHDLRRMGPVSKRLLFAIVLLPIIPATSAILVTLWFKVFGTLPNDEFNNCYFCASVIAVTATIIIWRAAIVWTWGRSALTGLVSLVPFVQVVYAQPLWDAGCRDIELCMGQYHFTYSFWIWLLIWVWWGWERCAMHNLSRSRSTHRLTMSPIDVRLMASFAVLPFTFGAFLVAGVAVNSFTSLADWIPGAYACAACVTVLVWYLVWRRVVAWSSAAFWYPLGLATILMGLPITATYLWAGGTSSDFIEVTLYALPIFGWGLWMAITTASWPIRPELRVIPGDAPRCPQCGYLLTGLTSTRCPECGHEPTLDELWAAGRGSGLMECK